MKWLKWHHKFSSGHHGWSWMVVSDDATEESVTEEILPSLAREYDDGEHYRGIDFEIVDNAPEWVIFEKIGEAAEREAAALREQAKYKRLMMTAEPCRQCAAARAPTREERGKPCPTCGRDVFPGSVPFWLMPDDVEAVKLLGSLVVKGPRTRKFRTRFRWPFDSKTEEDAFNRLCKLGLASGSTQYSTVTVEAGAQGAVEWEKHRLHNHSEWFDKVTAEMEAKDPEWGRRVKAAKEVQRDK